MPCVCNRDTQDWVLSFFLLVLLLPFMGWEEVRRRPLFIGRHDYQRVEYNITFHSSLPLPRSFSAHGLSAPPPPPQRDTVSLSLLSRNSKKQDGRSLPSLCVCVCVCVFSCSLPCSRPTARIDFSTPPPPPLTLHSFVRFLRLRAYSARSGLACFIVVFIFFYSLGFLPLKKMRETSFFFPFLLFPRRSLTRLLTPEKREKETPPFTHDTTPNVNLPPPSSILQVVVVIIRKWQ